MTEAHDAQCGCTACNQVRIDAGYEKWKKDNGHSDDETTTTE